VHLAKRIARVGIFDLAAAAAGMGLGIWTSLMTYTCPPCGPQEFCIMLLAQRFAAWQSALIGGATLAVILVVGVPFTRVAQRQPRRRAKPAAVALQRPIRHHPSRRHRFRRRVDGGSPRVKERDRCSGEHR